MAADAGDGALWEVIGGKDKGGIVVREGQDVASPQLERLETGAIIAQEGLVGDRLCFRLLRGAGPPTGWVSLKLKDGRALLKAVTASQIEATPTPASPWPGSSKRAPVQGRKLRIAALHGTPANSNIIKFQLSQLRSLLRKDAEWLFPDAPMPWAPIEGSSFPSEVPRSEGEVRIAQGKDFVQWYHTAVHGTDGTDDVWEGVPECNAFLERFFEQEAPVDVVVAFSQGSSAVSLFVEHLRRKQHALPWCLAVFFCGGNVDDATHLLQEACAAPALYVSGGSRDQFDHFIRPRVERMYPQVQVLVHEDGHNFPQTPPRAAEVYAEVAAAIRRHCGLADVATAAAAAPGAAHAAQAAGTVAAAARAGAGTEDGEEVPPGMWTVDYIGNARGACQACSGCEYYKWNPNKLRPEMGDDGGATITEWFLNDYDSLRCHGCRCKFSDHRSLGPVNKPAGYFPGLSEDDANALLAV